MKSMKKMLAAIMVFAIAFAGAAVIVSDDSGATGDNAVPGIMFKDADGDAIWNNVSGISNKTIGNKISVSVDASTNTYTITGNLAFIATLDEMKASLTAQNPSSQTTMIKNYYQTWVNNSIPSHAVVFEFTGTSDQKVIFFNDGVVKTEQLGDDNSQIIQYVSQSNFTSVYYVVPNDAVLTSITDQASFDAYVTNPSNNVQTITVVGNVSLDTSKNYDKGYVVVENANALAGTISSGTDGADGKWSLSGTTLTLTNYNGKEYFDGNYNEVILVGENSITLSGVVSALKNSAGAMTIKSIDGVGSLDIIMDSKSTGAIAIDSVGKLTINGVDVSIDVSESYSTAPASVSNYYTTKGIEAAGFEIYDGALLVNVAEENYYSAYGIFSIAAAVDVKSSDVEINAGSRGIHIEGAGNVTIAASDVYIAADQLGIRTGTQTAAVLSVTNESNVEVEVFGLAQGYYQPYGVSISGYMEVQSDSVLETDGMIVYGNGESTPASVNNATIINNADMVIWNTAKFDNAGQFINNGTVGIYGEFKNSKGETVNNSVLNNYSQWRASGYSGKTFVSTDGTTTLTITLDSMQPLANGKFLVKLETSTTEGDDDNGTYVGTMEYTVGTDAASTGYKIDAISSDNSAILTVTHNPASTTEKYNIYASQYTYSLITEKVAQNNNPVSADALKEAVGNNATGSKITITGGTFTNKGSVQVNDASTTFVAGGTFSNDGELEINDVITVTGGKLTGNDAVVAAGVTLTLSGEIDMVFSNSGSYTTTVSGNTSTVSFEDVVKVVGKPNAVVIATPTSATAPKGFLTISHMDGASGKSATVTIVKGSAIFSGNIGTDMVLDVESGATVQIDKTNGADAKNGVVAVQDGATFNMMVSSDRNTFGYGTLAYIISFANNGYTYYGSLQYALANAAEGATLNLNSNAIINTDTVVKKGITLVFADEKDLTITGTSDKKVTITMEEGAKFILGKNSDITISASYVTFSGTVVYDVNEIILDKVKFISDATISGSAASTTSASSVAINMDAVDGTVIVSKGLVTGTLNIDKAMQTTDRSKLDTTSKLVVSEGATFRTAANANSLQDSEYADTVIDGTLELTVTTTINGKISGDGSIVLKDGVKVTFGTKAVADVLVGNGVDAFVFDATKGTAYTSTGIYNPDNSKTFAVSAVAKTATKAAYVTIEGEILEGTVSTQGNVVFGTSAAVFVIGSKAVVIVPVDSTVTVGQKVSDNENAANGLLKVAGTLNMKVENDSSTYNYGVLSYQITYADGDYTVYTILSTGVSNATAGDSFEITKSLDISEKMEIPAGVTIIISDNISITVKNGGYITIGTPITSIGAVSSIQGKIVLEAGSFVIVYADDTVDMSKATIVTGTGTSEVAAKNSQFSVLNKVYATVYVPTAVSFDSSSVKNVLVPEIDGYRFLGWNALVNSQTPLGSTDFEGNMKAAKVQVIFQKVDGITYYVDNERQYLVGAPVYVDYGVTVTAVADYGYTGNALVNGKAYITVDSTTNTIIGSGVSPAEPEPTPVEPTEKDDGMGLTDILLIVLVILAAILVVVVAIRMMRS